MFVVVVVVVVVVVEVAKYKGVAPPLSVWSKAVVHSSSIQSRSRHLSRHFNGMFTGKMKVVTNPNY